MSSFMNLPNEPPVPLGYDATDGMQLTELYPLFTRISIETLSFCNRSCTFCPLHWSQDERGRKRMTDELYEKIVIELEELEFRGVAQMFLLSEPTIDTTMKQKLSKLRRACPKVTTYASSNGDLFDRLDQQRGRAHALKAIEEFYEAGLTVLNLNIYDPGPEQAARFTSLVADVVEKLHAEITESKYSKHHSRKRFIALTDMRIEKQGSAGNTDLIYIKTKAERASIVAPQRHCSRPHRHLVVEWDGNVPICCAVDVTDKSLPSMGNINQQSLVEVWNGEPMMKYRFYTQQAMRVLSGCSTCTHRMAYPHIVRKVAPATELQMKWEAERVQHVV